MIAVVATILSASIHLGLIAAGATMLPGWLATRHLTTQPRPTAGEAASRSPRTIDIDLPELALSEADVPEHPAPADTVTASPTGGEGTPRPDSGRSGRGGTDTAAQPAINLADRDDGLRLARDLANHIDRDQVSRVRSSKRRESWDDERLTTNPMELTFVASGSGREQERRPEAETTPSMGLAYAGAPSVPGGDRLGHEPVPEGDGLPPSLPGTEQLGGERSSPGAGIVDRPAGDDHRNSAPSELARPLVERGAPSVPSDQEGAPKDTVDSHQQVAAKGQSVVDSSTAGGRAGEGPGGTKGPTPTGAGGTDGRGSRSAPMGYGPGASGSAGVDPRVTAYRRRVLSRLWPHWEHAFPRWAIVALRQGTVMVSVEILSDGRVRNVRVTRPSGIDEFDRNCVAAVHRAAPFEPIPSNLGMRSLRWEISFDASNPAVR